MKKVLLTAWMTLVCYLLLGNVHAWDVPANIRLDAGARMWFSTLTGDLIQNDRTKGGLVDNIGLKPDKLAWEFFGELRLDNIHLFRLRVEPWTIYNESRTQSYLKIRDVRTGYDFDFFMTPQSLFGVNFELAVVGTETRTDNVRVANTVYNYKEEQTKVFPAVGIHGRYYPVVEGIALRPNVGCRFGWWNYGNLATWDLEFTGAFDIPMNRLWTWSISSGYRIWHIREKRDVDTVDMIRSGVFLESSLLF
jgi:hypothetical protein